MPAFDLPAHGEPDWDTKLNDSINAVKAIADQANSTGLVPAPAPTGNLVVDTANLQAILDVLSVTGGTLVLQKGDYLADLVMDQGPTGEQLPKIIGQGERYSRIRSLVVNGYEKHSSGCYLSDFGFSGHHPTTHVALDIVGAQSVHWDRLGFHATHEVGIRFYAPDDLTWTEKCCGQANFDDNCATPLKYEAGVDVTGHGSFNGCGLTLGSEINQSALSTAPIIDIGSKAWVYNAPLYAKLWIQNDSQPIVRNNGLAQCNFYGFFTIEQLHAAVAGKLIDPAGAAGIYFAGDMVVQQEDALDYTRFIKAHSIGNLSTGGPRIETKQNMPVVSSQAGKYIPLAGAAAGTNGGLGNGTLRLAPHYIGQTLKIDRVCAEVTVAGDAGCVFRIAIYNDAGGIPGKPLVNQSIAADVVLGAPTESTLSTPLQLNPGWYWVGGVIQGNANATLSSTLSTGGPITSLPITALSAAIASGGTISVTFGNSTQVFTLTAPASAGDTSVAVASATPIYAFPSGSVVNGIGTQPTLRTVSQIYTEFPMLCSSAAIASQNNSISQNKLGVFASTLPTWNGIVSSGQAAARISARLA